MADQAWKKLSAEALLGANYALRRLRTSPRVRGAALELLDELIAGTYAEMKGRPALTAVASRSAELTSMRAVLERIAKRANGPSFEEGDDPMDAAAAASAYAVDLATIGAWASKALGKATPAAPASWKKGGDHG